MLAALGYNLEAPVPVIEHEIVENGIGFLYAAKLHPALANVAVIRRELKVRTIFNMLGPLCNPAGAKSIVLGVYAPELTELFAGALLELGVRRALVVHGMEGIDEISCCGPTRVSELKDGGIRTGELLPELLIGASYDPAEIAGRHAGGECRDPAFGAERFEPGRRPRLGPAECGGDDLRRGRGADAAGRNPAGREIDRFGRCA